MKKLNREAFGRGREFILEQGRRLERALFRLRFEVGSVEDILAELRAYQNEDGGFGKALEPDLRTPSSSALATGIGLRMLRELGCTAEEQMVQDAVAYLRRSYDAESKTWRVAPEDTNGYPHAPWWHNEGESLRRRFDGYRIIPRALILGSLLHYAVLAPADWLEELTDVTVRYIEEVEVLGDGGGSDLEYAIYLAETRGLADSYVVRLNNRIREAIPTVVVRDASKWGSYCETPLRIAGSPGSLGAELIAEELQNHLDFQIGQQTAEGNWEPTWTWGGSYAEDWERARVEWCGVLTLETMTQLRAFGRVEGER